MASGLACSPKFCSQSTSLRRTSVSPRGKAFALQHLVSLEGAKAQAAKASNMTETPPAVAQDGKYKLGQNLNVTGISLFFQILAGNNSLAMPHVDVPNIRYVNWQAIKDAGFKGLVLDKDNTLSIPFALEVEINLKSSLETALKVFDGKAVLYSNSAGLTQYDPEGHEAATLEAALGMPVLRHRDKKPGGGKMELEQHFGCPSSHLVMVGDRYLTDVVFGNRHGMLTIHTTPMTTQGEPYGVVMARRIEEYFVARWHRWNIKPPALELVPGGDYTPFKSDTPLY